MDPESGQQRMEGVATSLAASPADAAPNNFVDAFLPAFAKPYAQLARLDRPIGWWLLLLPCWWSLALAAMVERQAPSIGYLALFLAGAIVMRGAGSTWNDILDRDLDAKVERTRSRPLPAGSLSTMQAALFLALQCLVGLLVLVQFNGFAVMLGLASLLPVIVYPAVKRVSNHPQLVLGLAFAWGGLMGWAAVFASLNLASVLLYLAAIFWTIGYDTIYALQDIEDDAIVGIGSTAIAYGDRAPVFVTVCYLVAIWLVLGALLSAGAGWAAMFGLLAFALHLVWQVRTVRTDNPRLALRLFRSNRDAGLLLFAGFAAEGLLRSLQLL